MKCDRKWWNDGRYQRALDTDDLGGNPRQPIKAKLHRVALELCERCIEERGSACRTPGCAYAGLSLRGRLGGVELLPAKDAPVFLEPRSYPALAVYEQWLEMYEQTLPRPMEPR